MPKIRVLVVDDSVVFRRLVSETLTSDPAIEVVGTAANGRIALQKIPQVNPDLVILDVEMPEMNGLEALAELRKTWPRLPVIMFSALTERGAAETLDALALGATDYFTKPNCVGGLDAALEVLRTQLIPEIKALCRGVTHAPPAPANLRPSSQGAAAARPSSQGAQPIAVRPSRPFVAAHVEAVLIAASTGGPNALAAVFSALPADLPVPVLIVQHMPPMFTKLLAERLTAEYPIPVEEAASGVLLQPGRAWIAPGDYHVITVRDGTKARLLIHQDPPENSCRPAADVLFRAAARTFGNGCLAVVLTGMGQDGLRGCELIREAGGQILAQDEITSVVWGMPGYVAKAGLADHVLPLALIGPEIVERVRRR